MGILYIGDCDFKEVSDASFDVDDYGLDEVIRTYGGREDRLAAFLDTIEDGKPDRVFPDLTAITRRRNVRFDGPFAYVTQSFKGLFGGQVKPERARVELQERTVTLTRQGSAVTITYMAPVTTWMYATRNRPTHSRFARRLLPIYSANPIIDIVGSEDAEVEEGEGMNASVSRNSYLGRQDRYRFFRAVVQTGFTQEQEGDYWGITEINEARLLDANRTYPELR